MAAPLRHYLDFERPIAELEAKLEELSSVSETAGPGAIDAEVAALRARIEDLKREAYARLDPWQKTLVARHPQHPTSATISPA
jgi:acetyl-CoA carboxylase carboxyl transferase subunit alpha